MIILSFYNKSHGKIYNIINSKHFISYCVFIIRKIIVRFQNLQGVLFTTFSENNDIFSQSAKVLYFWDNINLKWDLDILNMLYCDIKVMQHRSSEISMSLKYNFNFSFLNNCLTIRIHTILYRQFIGQVFSEKDKNKAKFHTIMM